MIIRLITLILLLSPVTANADWVQDFIVDYALENLSVEEYKEPNGDVWAIWYGGPLPTAKCKYVEYKSVVPCMVEFSGNHKVSELRTTFPICFKDEEAVPDNVRARCIELNPPTVASYITGSRPLYDGHAMYAWHIGGKIGTMPKKKIGTVATQTPCGPIAAAVNGTTVWWWTKNVDGVIGTAYCK